MNNWQPTYTDDLVKTIKEFEKTLPDWWWSLGTCHVSRDASCGPDSAGEDAYLLEIQDEIGVFIFDEGFHCDCDGTLSYALRNVIEQALSAKIKYNKITNQRKDGP